MMVLDTSAVIAILRLEAEADDFLHAIADSQQCFISTVSTIETAMVLAGRSGTVAAWAPLDEFLTSSQISVVSFDQDQVQCAREAFLRFGKGRHPAALNLGDCAAYALAMTHKLPLLFKGDDFSKTDVTVALPRGATH